MTQLNIPIESMSFPNGLRVVVSPDRAAPVATVGVYYNIGFRIEPRDRTGFAHLFEHMLFQGSEHVGTHDHFRLLQQVGGVANGSTWYDRTNYYETLPASEENLEFAIRLEADRMVNSNVKGEDLKSEMTVVRNEFERGENSPEGVLMERISAAASFSSFSFITSSILPPPRITGWAAPVLVPGAIAATSEDSRIKKPAEAARLPLGVT